MSWRRMYAVMLRYFYLLRGSVSRVAPLFSWVAVDIVLWGFLSRYLNTIVGGGFNFVPALLGAILLWDFFIRVMQGVTMTFFEDVWSRNFLNYFATPLSIPEYVGGLVMTSIFTSAVGLIVMVLLAGVFGLSYLVYGALLVPFLLMLFMFGISLGIIACAVVLRMGPASEWFIWPIPAFLSPFVGVLYPMSTLPRGMRAIGWLLPPSHVFEGLRAVLTGGPSPIHHLLWSALLNVLFLFAAMAIFSRTHRYAIRTGLIARYSAESVA